MNITPRDIVDRLKTDMDAVCKYLLPGGKRSGSEWEVGSTAGEAGKSLKIHLNGEKAGVWSDFATSQSGDVLDLWCAVRGIDLGQAIREAKSYLGINDPAWEGHKPRQYTRPERPKKARKPTSAVTEYFSGRGITEATLKAFRIAEEPGPAHFSRLKDNPATIVFPFLRDDELIAVKYLAIQRIDGKKQTLVEKGCEPCLFGWQALPSGVRNVALTEGECFPGNAEVLTEDGWVCLDRYNGGRVAQVNVDGSSEWVYPLARIDKPYDGHLLERQCRGYYSLTTPGHKLIAIDNKGRWYTHTAEQGAKARAHLIPRVTALDGQGIPLTDDQLRLAIAVSADGSIDIRKCAYGNKPARNIPIERRYVRFGFKKIRKIQRLREVLTACGIESSDTAIGNGYRSICFSLPDWVPGRLFPREWIGLATLAQRRLILDEMVYWDGNQVQNRAQTEYSTKWIENAIFIQTMAHTSGFCSTVMRRSNTFGEWFKVSVLTEKKTTSWQCLKENRIRYQGRVYCLQVPSGMLLVRQNGKITVSGNCDAMTLQQFGIAALSVPMGAGNHQWIEYEYERLERFDQIFLCFDQDSAGQKAVGELVERLGRHRCRIVKLGHKDANECLQRGWTVKEFADAFMAAKTMDPQALRSAADYVDEVVAEFYPPPDRSPGLRTPWQKVGENLLFRAAEVSLWTGYNGHGKALSLETPIPTPDGWKRLADIHPGDFVFDDNGKPCRVVAETPVMIGRPCYRVAFSDGSEIVADAAHEWLTYTAKARQSRRTAIRNDRLNSRPLKKRGNDQSHKRTFASIVETQQIAKTLTVKWGNRENLINHSIPVAGALKCLDRNLPIDAYLLGVWLGDGNSNDSGITTADQEIVNAFIDGGCEVRPHRSQYRYGVKGGFYRQLRIAGLLNNKHIPEVYMRASIDQRLALLQGLMDTDGSITPYGRCEFTTIRMELAFQVQEIVLSLGMQANVITGRATLFGKDCGPKFRVTFTPHLPVFRLPRKAKRLCSSVSDRLRHRFIVACDPVQSVPVKCIEVDSSSHLYLAGSSMIPTHNSQALNFVMANAMACGARVCIASMELPPRRLLYRLTKQLCGTAEPSIPYIRAAHRWLEDRLWLFDAVGTVKAAHILEVFAYARQRYRVTHFVLDSLSKCGLAEDDYNGQKALIEGLCDFAHAHDVHVYLVAHARKGHDERGRPGKMDVKGTGALTDMVDTVITVWRNKGKEEGLEEARINGEEVTEEFLSKPDGSITVSKQRNGSWEGTIALWFDHETLQYHGSPGFHAIQYVDYSAQADTRKRYAEDDL